MNGYTKKMSAFNFGRPVQICGEVFYITNDQGGAAEALKKLGEKAQGAESEEEMEEISKEAIDSTLGKGSFEKIFNKDNPYNIQSMIQLTNFLTAEITQWTIETRKIARKRK